MLDSILIRTVFDLIVLAIFALGGYRLQVIGTQFRAQRKGINLILTGIGIGLFYFLIEIFAIWALPSLIDPLSAQQLYELLYLDVRPFFIFAAFLFSGFGLYKLTVSLFEAQTELQQKAEQARVKEAENRVLLSQLHQNQKVESLGTLAGGIAHDFNNILSSIINSAELLQMYLGDDQKARKNTDRIIQNGKKASKLIRQILTFSRMDSQELKPCDLSKLVAEDLDIVRATIPSYINIETDIDTDVGNVLADRTQISQVTINLITNAYHAIGDQPGKITISVKRCDLSECKPANQQIDTTESVVLMVSDTGCGMDEAIQQRMFDPFFTTKEVGKGTGLGLSSVHGIVESHKGAISVESTPGSGTTIKVCFPSSAGHEEAETSQKKITGAIGKVILLVEDNPELGSLIKEHLERRGNRVRHETDGAAALDTFRSKPGQFDLLITDQAVPNLSGRQLAEQLLQTHPELPILLMTGYSEAISETQAREMGIREFILKPFSLAELDRSVANCFEAQPSPKHPESALS